MARRALQRHRQQSFRAYSKPLDKNGQLRGARKGERRKHVGRPKQGPRASERLAKKGIRWSVGRTFAGQDEIYSFDLREQSNFNLSTQP
ncbi:MAG: hypothetical protein ABI467_28215, partial [Kofleriaceae bacterium]